MLDRPSEHLGEHHASVEAQMYREVGRNYKSIARDLMLTGPDWFIITSGFLAFGGSLVLFWAGMQVEAVWLKFVIVLSMSWYFLVMFNITHEGSHRNMFRGLPAAQWLNEAFCTFMSAAVMTSFHGFRHAHHIHHRHSNDELRDSNFWIVRRQGLGLSITLGFAPFLENYNNIKTASRSSTRLVVTIMMNYVAVAAVFGLVAWAFGLVNAIIFWVLPAYLNYIYVVLFVAYLPHRLGFEATDAFIDDPSRVRIFGRFKQPWQTMTSILFFGNNHHLLHHVYPQMPARRLDTLAVRMTKERARDAATREG